MSLIQKLKLATRGSSYELTQALLEAVTSGDVDAVIRIGTQNNKQGNKQVSFRYRDEEGNCAIHLAILYNQPEIARLLLEFAPETCSRKNKKSGNTPLHLAVLQGNSEMINILNTFQPPLEDLNDQDMTSLMIAADQDDVECALQLLKLGAKKLTANKRNLRAIDFARSDSQLRDILSPHKRQASASELNVRETRTTEVHSPQLDDSSSKLPVHKQYKIERRIGEGAYAESYIAKNSQYRFECVLKLLQANNIDDINNCLAEGLTLALFKDCKRIIGFKDFFIDLPEKYRNLEFVDIVKLLTGSQRLKPGSRGGNCRVNLAMAWARGGDLFHLVSDRLLAASEEEDRLERELYEQALDNGNFDEKEICVEPEWFTEEDIVRIGTQICEALHEIHECRFIHRDIKPGNLFMDEHENIMVGDFGIAKFVDDHAKQQAAMPAHTVIGSQNYMAAEMHDRSKPYNQSVDIFALGCVIYFLVKFNHPNFFMKDALQHVLPAIKDECTDFVYRFVERLWDRNPNNRPTALEAIEWMKQRHIPPRRFGDTGGDEQSLNADGSDSSAGAAETDTKTQQARKVSVRRRYAVGKRLSENMYKARHLTEWKKYIMKRMPCHSLEDINARLQEAAHLAHLRRSPHVVGFQDLFLDLTLKRELDDNFDPKNNDIRDDTISVCIVMQFCAGGALHEYLSKLAQELGHFPPEEVHVDEHTVLAWLHQVASGLRDIHKSNVVHRNIRTENLFLTEDNSLLIGEFGSAKDTRTFGDARTLVGSPEYMAPEMISMGHGKNRTYSSAVDIFSLGVAFQEMLTLKPPSFCDTTHIPIHYSNFVHEIADRMMQPDPKDRPNAEQLVSIIDNYFSRARTSEKHFDEETMQNGVKPDHYGQEPYSRGDNSARTSRSSNSSSAASNGRPMAPTTNPPKPPPGGRPMHPQLRGLRPPGSRGVGPPPQGSPPGKKRGSISAKGRQHHASVGSGEEYYGESSYAKATSGLSHVATGGSSGSGSGSRNHSQKPSVGAARKRFKVFQSVDRGSFAGLTEVDLYGADGGEETESDDTLMRVPTRDRIMSAPSRESTGRSQHPQQQQQQQQNQRLASSSLVLSRSMHDEEHNASSQNSNNQNMQRHGSARYSRAPAQAQSPQQQQSYNQSLHRQGSRPASSNGSRPAPPSGIKTGPRPPSHPRPGSSQAASSPSSPSQQQQQPPQQYSSPQQQPYSSPQQQQYSSPQQQQHQPQQQPPMSPLSLKKKPQPPTSPRLRPRPQVPNNKPPARNGGTPAQTRSPTVPRMKTAPRPKSSQPRPPSSSSSEQQRDRHGTTSRQRSSTTSPYQNGGHQSAASPTPSSPQMSAMHRPPGHESLASSEKHAASSSSSSNGYNSPASSSSASSSSSGYPASPQAAPKSSYPRPRSSTTNSSSIPPPRTQLSMRSVSTGSMVPKRPAVMASRPQPPTGSRPHPPSGIPPRTTGRSRTNPNTPRGMKVSPQSNPVTHRGKYQPMHHAQYTRPASGSRSPPPHSSASHSSSHNAPSSTMPRRGAQASEKADKVRAAMLARDKTMPALRAMPNFASGRGVATPMALVNNGAVAVNNGGGHPPCSVCTCSSFVANRFRPNICADCFHTH